MLEPRSAQPVEPKGVALLVDDNDRYLSMLTRFVQSLGYFCVAAENGAEALQWLETNRRPDVMLCDLKMPEMSGITLLEEMKKRSYDVPVLVITAVDDRETLQRCMDLGAVDYVTKPFEISQLRERIDRAITRAPRRQTGSFDTSPNSEG